MLEPLDRDRLRLARLVENRRTQSKATPPAGGGLGQHGFRRLQLVRQVGAPERVAQDLLRIVKHLFDRFVDSLKESFVE